MLQRQFCECDAFITLFPYTNSTRRGAGWATDPVVVDMLGRGIVKPPPEDQDDAAPRVEA